MIQLWFLLSLLSRLSHALSTSLDKYLINQNSDPIKISNLKVFFTGIITLIIGLLFFNLNITLETILWAGILGIFFATTNIVYFLSLRLKDVEEVAPFAHSGIILLIFLSSISLFKEMVTTANYFGVVIILGGVYIILSKKGFKLPKPDKGLFLMSIFIIVGTIYWLLVKTFVTTIEPINLVIVMYFSCSLVLFIFRKSYKKSDKNIFKKIKKIPLILGALTAGIGTTLIYWAFEVGNASKVAPTAGLQLIFVFIIASLFLKEKFYWNRLIGTIIITIGTYLIYI
ncbi:DMT family transporter [archaeon]|nr:DMT family transporter [archaeon]